METRYDPKTVEQRWYATWDERGYFKPRDSLTGKTFTISMPPPNITGDLHMGHAMYTLQDVLIRWHRMLGDAALWVPGTDHAAIATQNVLEKQLAKKGTTKEAIGREAWDRLVNQWYETTGHTILGQMRRLGFSADWSRNRFTMDQAYVEAIRYVFVQLWKEGLIYRGPRIVNWCPRDQSAISDLEVQYVEEDGHLYYLDYPVEGGGTIPVATARPETMVGDTGVAVHPDDWRYKDLIGKHVVLPIVHRRVPIVADEAVDQEFGTGAVKVTPGHDATDYDIGERHHLPVLSILTLDGRMNIHEVAQLPGRPPDSRVDLCQRPRGRLPQSPAAVRAVRRPASNTGPGRARYMVLVIALALRHARMAGGHARSAPLLSDAGARHRPRHPLSLGGPHGLHEPALPARRALLGGLDPRHGAGARRPADEQVARDRR